MSRKPSKSYQAPASGPQGITLPVSLVSVLMDFSSDDMTRPQLMGPACHVDPAGVAWIAATDGTALVRAPLAPSSTDARTCRWDGEKVSQALKVAKALKAPTVLLAWEDAADTGKACFPAIDQVTPSPGVSAGAVIALNPSLMARASKAAASIGDDGQIVLRSCAGPLDPMRWDVIEFASGNTLAEIVIMPMRMNRTIDNGPTADRAPTAEDRLGAKLLQAEIDGLRVVIRDDRARMIDTEKCLRLAREDAEEQSLAANKAREDATHWEAVAVAARARVAELESSQEGTTITTTAPVPSIEDAGPDHVILVSRSRVPRRLLASWGR